MDALIFTLAVILSVIGLSSIMNYAVRKMITAPLSQRSAVIFRVSPGDYEVVKVETQETTPSCSCAMRAV